MGDLPKSCKNYALVPIEGESPSDGSFDSVQKLLQMGFELSWSQGESPIVKSEYSPLSRRNYFQLLGLVFGIFNLFLLDGVAVLLPSLK